MADPTEADRERAKRAFSEWIVVGSGEDRRIVSADERERIDAIAQAIADAREEGARELTEKVKTTAKDLAERAAQYWDRNFLGQANVLARASNELCELIGWDGSE